MASDAGVGLTDLMQSSAVRSGIRIEKYVSQEVGLPTLQDIMDELNRPGRDPREQFEAFAFAEGIEKPEDLRLGMKLPGLVTNVTQFGAFVDIGVHQDGLVHISQLADQFVRDPNEVVKVAQRVMVTVTELDLDRKRIGLSMKAKPEMGGRGSSGGNPRSAGRSGSSPQPRKSAGKDQGGFNALADALNRAAGKE